MELEQQQQPVNLKELNFSRISQSSINIELQEDYYGGYSGRSLELNIRVQQEDNEFKKKNLQIELSIVDYLSSLNIKMKTDPKAKQDRFFSNLRNLCKRRAFTQLEIERDSSDNTPDTIVKGSQVSISTNPLLEKRKTQLSFVSTNQSIQSQQVISILQQEGKIIQKQSQFESEEMDAIISNQSLYQIK
ncbi:unnamed protein product [Paramecium sonneborni]|uniref:Uncharacterized protein n=1 Tax=Paramecium sonneborni TaxID=65129 RepID=A0A8S1L4H8_9CILI|nr:unnamed protein product [Paramecium sonneborni]